MLDSPMMLRVNLPIGDTIHEQSNKFVPGEKIKAVDNSNLNPFTPKSDLIDFTLSNARRFYSSKGDPLGVKGLKNYVP